MNKRVNLLGQVFGKLKVINKDKPCKGTRNSKWVCECECGSVISVLAPSLKSGNTRSCGCLRRERHTHNKSNTAEYKSWSRIMLKETRELVCEEWVANFPAFLADMGDKPTAEYNLIRLRSTVGYTKDNCIWATGRTKTKNVKVRQNTHQLYKVGRLTLTLEQWAVRLNLPVSLLVYRLNEGWTTRKTMETTRAGERKQIRWAG